jgi:hypothetical protein
LEINRKAKIKKGEEEGKRKKQIPSWEGRRALREQGWVKTLYNKQMLIDYVFTHPMFLLTQKHYPSQEGI